MGQAQRGGVDSACPLTSKYYQYVLDSDWVQTAMEKISDDSTVSYPRHPSSNRNASRSDSYHCRCMRSFWCELRLRLLLWPVLYKRIV